MFVQLLRYYITFITLSTSHMQKEFVLLKNNKVVC